MKINPLLCIPSPRDIPQVIQEHDKIPFHKIYSKNMPEVPAYAQFRNYFLEHQEFTHLVICPDDLVVTKKDIEELIKDLEENDYPVLSGICNVGGGNLFEKVAITHNLPMIHQSNYEWWSKGELVSTNKKILKVGFSGFPCMFIRRDIVEQITFQGIDCGSRQFRALDLKFAHNCNDENIPIHVDTEVLMLHLKGVIDSQTIQKLGVGRKPEALIVIPPDNSYNKISGI